ncbi:MAG: glycosyl hydrolase family 8 [Candidatus Electrothrix sp.]
MKKNGIILIFLLMLPCFSAFAANYPFPQNSTYAYGILPTAYDATSDVQTIYETWRNAYYEESGELARIKFDAPDQTVSEGIAYGMLIMVFMDNTTNDTQDAFDKLWKYYNSFLNNNGLMHWKISGFKSVTEQNAATDAEVDAALALIMAYKQWGDVQYLTDAKALIAKIRQHEVNSNKYLKPGDVWDDKKNPSYFSIVALRLFAEVDTGYMAFWNEVIANSYSLILAARNSTTGLVPDWCDETGKPLDTNFSYDAVRVPWRMAWAYLWYGDADAHTVADDISSWIKTAVSGDPTLVKDGYNLDGSVSGSWNNPTFVGGFTTAALVDSQHQAWLDASSAYLVSFTDDQSYFNKTLQMLYALLATGNMPNLWEDTEASSGNAFLPAMLLLLL